MGILSFFSNMFKKAHDKIAGAWKILQPVLVQVFQAELGVAVAGLRDLALQAIAQVATQGLPTDDAKRKAFCDYMKDALKKQGKESGQQAIDTALVVWLAYAKQNNLPH